MTPSEVRQELSTVRNYYADKDGTPYPMNDAKWAVYCAGLAPFSADKVRAAAHRWMQESKWFPALSDLIAILRPKADYEALALLAWSTVERATRAHGAYATVQFENPAVGQTVQEVFGSWPTACSQEIGSFEFGAKRKAFLAIFPVMMQRGDSMSPKLLGIHRSPDAALVRANQQIALHEREKPQLESFAPSRDEAKRIVGNIENRWESARGHS